MRVPPGRAGRQWLRERLAVAERGAALLDRKLSVLDEASRRLAAERDTARLAWEAAHRRAVRRQARAALLGGTGAIRLATAGPARIEVTTTTLAGVCFPDSVDCVLPQDFRNTVTGSATLLAARGAHRDALAAGVRYAAAAAAARAVERELAATRIRLRGLRHRRIPALRTAAATLEFALEEQERADRVRVARAVDRDNRIPDAATDDS
ncbi:V-type ATPase, D subunit [Nocardia sp. ET3-3]|uniref:V-type ATPase, D subunit n=1 Tax=Nocardia terrae TaxID=2675851 RepID=A0A7K1UVX1_9NOCA|nr:V-type ATP synthase subunit D [Nocardia terrae]MVU78457.1 V-type ATPase, D subunit [Nocardia terrae]